MLAAPEKVAGAARFQIVLRHGKAVCRGAEEFEPLLDRLARVVADEEAPALRRTAAYPAAQLVQSAQAVALGVLDDHDRCVRHVHTDLDDGGGDQCVQLPGLEVLHDGGFFLWLELAVHQADPAVGQQRLGDVFVVGLHSIQPAVGGVLDGGADDIHLPPGVDLPVKEAVEVPPFLPGDAPGLDRLAARRQFVENRDVEVAVEEQPQGAGDGRGAHDQQVGVLGFFGQQAPLPHPEAVLLVHHGQTQPGKGDPLAEDGVGAHHEVGLVVPDGGQRGAAGGGFHAAGQQGDPHPERGQHPVQVLGMLGSQNLGGGQQRCLIAAADAGPDGGCRHQRFAAAHIALQQAVHGLPARHVGQDLRHGPPLGPGGGEGQRVPERLRVEKLHRCPGGGAAPVLHPADAQLQNEQFFVDEPPPGRKGGFLALRAVDGPHGLCLGEQAVFLAHLRRQRIGQKLGMGEQLADTPGDDAARKPIGLGVDGLEGGGGDLRLGAHLRVDHLAAEHPAGHDALKIIGLPQFQLLGGVGVVEPGDLQAGNIVPRRDPLHPPPAGQDASAGLGEHLGLHDALGVARCLGNGVGL